MSNRSRFLGATLLLAFLAPASSALAWPTVEPEGHRVPVLGGRWTVALPENTVRAAPQAPPGSPPARDELDSAAFVQTDEGNFGLRAALLESTRPADLDAAVRTLPAPCPTPAYGTVADRTDMVAIRCTEASPDGAFRPITVYAVHTDGWVDRIEALVETTDPANEAGRTSGVAFAEAVVATLRAAEMPQPVARGTVEIARVCEEGEAFDRLTVTLPSDWIAIQDALPNGTLSRLTRVVPLGDGRAMAAVELEPAGTAPARVPAGSGRHVHGAMLGTDADWLVLQPEGATVAMHQLAYEITVDCGGGATFARALRLSIGGPADLADGAQRVLETIALESARGHTVSVTPVSSESEPADHAAAGELTPEERAAEEQGHFWSIAIGGVSVLVLVAALVMRARASKPK